MKAAYRKMITGALMMGALFSFWGAVCAGDVILSPEEIERISERIFYNECGGKESALLFWNEGEDFPSLGIGHFIWYSKDRRGPFRESFPDLLIFLERKGVELPEWLRSLPDRRAPWDSREAFIQDLRNGRMDPLKKFLADTKIAQTEFIVERLSQSLPLIIQAASPEARGEVREKLSLMRRARAGWYPLVDYVNFNGEGTLVTERYRGQGWGLIQVLEEMDLSEARQDALAEFVKAAERVLDRRVANSPPGRNEARWLAGWKFRMRTYIETDPPVGLKKDNHAGINLATSGVGGVAVRPGMDEMATVSGRVI